MKLRILGALAALLLLVPATASAVHWPYFGGDAGRSGLQPVDEGATPVTFSYALTGAPHRDVVTPIITTAGGGPAVQRVAYGTRAGQVHLRVVANGAAVTPEEGRDIDDGEADADVFGDATGFTGFADSSTATALGQLYVLHNDDDAVGTADVQVAQIDEATGEVVRQIDVPDTDGVDARSTPVLTGPDAGGGRILFFTLSDGTLRRVAIAAAGTRDAMFGAVTAAQTDRATPTASPTFVNLRRPDGTVAPHIAVGTRDNTVATFAAADLAPGPVSEGLRPPPVVPDVEPPSIVQTPVVPVAPDGMPPASAPFIYVAVETGGNTTVHKLSQEGNGGLVERAESDQLPGVPATAVAVSQKAAATVAEGKVLVTTADNLFVVNTSDLKGTFQYQTDAEADAEGGASFARNVPLVAGNFVFVTTDAGRQLVLSLVDVQPVPEGDFKPDVSTAGATEAVGQPSLSRGFVQYGTSAGLATYRTRDLVPPAAALSAPADGATVSGTVSVGATASDARGVAAVTFRLEGRPFATDTMPDAGSPFSAATPAAFSATLDTTRIPNGTYTLDAVADDRTLTFVAPGRRITVRNGGTVIEEPKPEPPITGRVRARRITAGLRPNRDRRAPFRFTVSGRVSLPTGVTRDQGCGQGRVRVQFKAGRKTIATRRVRLGANCTYRSTVRFKNRKRFGRRSKLTVRVRFLGNDRLRPQTIRTLRPRVR